MTQVNLGHVRGEDGADGQGVPTGGTSGQYLKKVSGTDFDTAWESFTNATQAAAGMMSSTDKTKLDGLSNVEDGIAIVSVGNTHPAIAQGQYVYIKQHVTLAEGLYKATSAISTNGTLNVSNVSAVSGGLGTEVASLNNNINKYSPLILATDNAPAIPANSNLNDYTDSGVYRIENGTIAATITNMPDFTGSATSGGRLIVFATSGNGTTGSHTGAQVLFSNVSGIICYRNFWTDGRIENWHNVIDYTQDILSHITWSVSPDSRYVKFEKSGNNYELTYYTPTNTTITHNQLIGTFDDGYYAPKRGFYVPFYNDSDGKPANGGIYLSPTKTIKYYGDSITGQLNFHATWIL